MKSAESFLEKPLNMRMPCIYPLSLYLSLRRFVLTEFRKFGVAHKLSLLRNWLARSAVNRKVGGSSPPRDVLTKRILVGFLPCTNTPRCVSALAMQQTQGHATRLVNLFI